MSPRGQARLPLLLPRGAGGVLQVDHPQILVERASSRREDGERIRRDVKVDTPLLQRVLFDGMLDNFEACIPRLPGLTLYGSDLVDYRRLARLSRRTREVRRFLHREAVFYHLREGGGHLHAV